MAAEKLKLIHSETGKQLLSQIAHLVRDLDDKFSDELYTQIINFTSQLMVHKKSSKNNIKKSKKQIEKTKEVIEANLVVDFEKKKRDAVAQVEKFLRESKLGDTVHVQLKYEDVKNKFNYVINDQEGWISHKGSKRYNITCAAKKYDVYNKNRTCLK